MARTPVALALLFATASSACSPAGPPSSAPHTYELGTIGGFAELVN